jgi:hypothetical protein
MGRTKGSTDYEQEVIELGLMAMALENGSTQRAVERLEGLGDLERIPSTSTLKNWRDQMFPEQYAEVKVKVREYVAESVAERHMRAADDAMEVENLMRDKAKAEYEQMDARDLPGAVRNMATVGAIHTDKATILRGQPTAIVEHRSVEEIERELKAHGVEIIDGTAEEDAQIEEGTEQAQKEGPGGMPDPSDCS